MKNSNSTAHWLLLFIIILASILYSANLAKEAESQSITASARSFLSESLDISGENREDLAISYIFRGFIPSFLTKMVAIDVLEGKTQLTFFVSPDYLSIGHNFDFVRMPLGLPSSLKVANHLGMILPTTKMVDLIYKQANVKLSPVPMKPGNSMASNNYIWQHNSNVEKRLASFARGKLVAGHKKDLVLTKKLIDQPGRVAIYGWHNSPGNKIQPLSLFHHKNYSDYSHGIRLVFKYALLNGEVVDLYKILRDPKTAHLLSREGPIDLKRINENILSK